MTRQATIPAVRRAIVVDAPPEHAFSVFTEGIATWWPREASHNVGPTPADAVMEPFEGGRCFARAYDGTETDWGRVVAWEPPERVVFAWLLKPPDWTFEPDPAKASEVEVRFAEESPGHTRVELEHRGFERYATGGDGMREAVDSAGGWQQLLELYAGVLRS